jgi:hypothetical protein
MLGVILPAILVPGKDILTKRERIEMELIEFLTF